MNTATKKSTATPAAAPEQTERVKLDKQHTHGGVTYEAGASLTVSASTAEWLRGQCVVAKKPTTATEE